jgi:hypothetical protein
MSSTRAPPLFCETQKASASIEIKGLGGTSPETLMTPSSVPSSPVGL